MFRRSAQTLVTAIRQCSDRVFRQSIQAEYSDRVFRQCIQTDPFVVLCPWPQSTNQHWDPWRLQAAHYSSRHYDDKDGENTEADEGAADNTKWSKTNQFFYQRCMKMEVLLIRQSDLSHICLVHTHTHTHTNTHTHPHKHTHTHTHTERERERERERFVHAWTCTLSQRKHVEAVWNDMLKDKVWRVWRRCKGYHLKPQNSYLYAFQYNCKKLNKHSTKKLVTTMLTYPWKCTVLHCNHLGNTWKPLVLMTRCFDYCPSASEGDNQSVRSSAPVVSKCFPGDYNVKLYISRDRLAWWLLAFLHSETLW